MALPVELPDIASARLPATYERAKQALAECMRIDECKTWADKMAALASYARQANDAEFAKVAMRIQGRATRRCGELLSEFDARPQNATKQSDGEATLIPRRDAAEAAGMSKRQQVTAVRVARIPTDQFEAAVESDDPPTVTALAEMGRKTRPVKIIDLTGGRDPREFNLAMHTLGDLRRFAEKAQNAADVAAIARGSFPEDYPEALKNIEILGNWLVSLKRELESYYVQRQRSEG